MLLGVLRSVLLEEVVPLLLLGGTLSGVLVVEVIDLLGNDEGLFRVEAKQRLDALAVVSLERVSVDTTGALEFGSETNGCGKLDHGWLVCDFLGLLDSSLDASQVSVTFLDPLNVPAIGFESLRNILSESNLSVAIYEQSVKQFSSSRRRKLTNGDMVIIINTDQIAQLKMASSASSLASDTFHSTAITKDAVCVVIKEVVSRLVKDGTGVSLSDGQTDGIGETLTEGTGGDFDTGSIMSLGVTGCDAIDLLLVKLSTHYA